MSTRSRIGIKNSDGTITSVYCHFDGYPTGVGAELKTNHNTKEKAAALIALGDLSTVCGGVSAYHRDRGEEFSQQTDSSVKGFLKTANDTGAEYAYLFDKNEWKTYTVD